MVSKQYAIGIIPVCSFDSDLGLKFGAVINMFDSKYQKYPDYDQFLNLKVSYTTRNTLNMQALFESERFVSQATTILEATYTNDRKLDFFGFNGVKSIYDANFGDPDRSGFISNQFYNQNRTLIRLRADVQKNIVGDQLRLLTGIAYHNVMFDLPDEVNETQESLFVNYVDWGIIDEEERYGGNNNYFSLGLIYDSRNDKCCCTKGSWFETYVIYAPRKLNKEPFSKFIITYRYYHRLFSEKYIFSMRLSSQNRLSGKIPTYMLPFYFDSQINQDGLGGAYTLRGITRNRIVADGFALGNFETRIQLGNIRLMGIRFYLGTTFFCDLAFITQAHPVDLSKVPEQWKSKLFDTAPQKLYIGYGPGFNIVFNKNNVITVNYGFSPDKRLGNGGLYIGSQFLF